MEEFFGLIGQLPNATDGSNGKQPGDDESISSLAKIARRGTDQRWTARCTLGTPESETPPPPNDVVPAGYPQSRNPDCGVPGARVCPLAWPVARSIPYHTWVCVNTS